jgi:hypothetical protein
MTTEYSIGSQKDFSLHTCKCFFRYLLKHNCRVGSLNKTCSGQQYVAPTRDIRRYLFFLSTLARCFLLTCLFFFKRANKVKFANNCLRKLFQTVCKIKSNQTLIPCKRAIAC